MDISSGTGWPAANLSNFTPHPFVIDGIECNSMEGFLQSLKFSNPDMQKEACKLVGKAAKFKGKKKKWWKTQTLFWQGKELSRHGNGENHWREKAVGIGHYMKDKFILFEDFHKLAMDGKGDNND